MAVWLIRAGGHGEFEQKFIQENRVYVTWDDLNDNLSKMRNRDDLYDRLADIYPDSKPKRLHNWVAQIWPFAHEMEKGDLTVLPLKSQPSIYIGEITGDYRWESKGPNPFYHWRPVKWIGESLPRTNFGTDLLYSFGAFLTICRIRRNNAEARIAAMRAKGWKAEAGLSAKSKLAADGDEGDVDSDLGQLAQDQIAELIAARFSGHGLTRLVEGILKAQGYTTYRSPAGPDGGSDILAGSGHLGFAAPRLCVEVKSDASPTDRPTVDKLLGAISKFGASEGLFVAWSGFKGNVQKELAGSFFRVRLWTQKELLQALFENYDRLDDELKAELPLKRIWTVAAQTEE